MLAKRKERLLKSTKIILLLGSLFCALSASSTNTPRSAEAIYKVNCAPCHSGALLEAPKIEALKLFPPERIVTSLESGIMSTAGMALSKSEKTELAEYLTGKKVETIDITSSYTCKANNVSSVTEVAEHGWNGWGRDNHNKRFQPSSPSITAKSVSKLKLKWAFGFPSATRVRAQPVVTKDSVFIGSQAGIIYALDVNTGCVHWEFQATTEVRGALFLKGKNLLFGDLDGYAYSISSITGELNWRTQVHENSLAVITGSVIADDKKVYVPVSSLEIIPAARAEYECCSFRGAVVALELDTGKKIWTTFTTEKPQPTYKTSVGTQQFGPSGAPVWSGPTLDKARNLLYATTGQNYSSPATTTSDAVLAIDLDTGKIQWHTQLTKGDAWNGACSRKTPNCPKENGPDYDIGASAMLASIEGDKQLLIIGQKSGMVNALDPDMNGKIIWKQRVGSGGTMGGVHWGMSTNDKQIFVGVSDLPTNNPYNVGPANPGLHSLDIKTGKFLWRNNLPNVCPKEGKFLCFPGISAAVSSSTDLVYAGGLDGMLRVFSAKDGTVLWKYNSNQKIETVNGIAGLGGSIESDGPVIAFDKLFVTSGYDKWGEAPGNILLVFSIDGK